MIVNISTVQSLFHLFKGEFVSLLGIELSVGYGDISIDVCLRQAELISRKMTIKLITAMLIGFRKLKLSPAAQS